jgi:hypothetical protein
LSSNWWDAAAAPMGDQQRRRPRLGEATMAKWSSKGLMVWGRRPATTHEKDEAMGREQARRPV